MTSVRGERVFIRRLEPTDAKQVLDLRVANRDFFQPWEPTREESAYRLEGVAAELELSADLWDRDDGYVFGIFENDRDETLVGGIALRNVVRGAWQNAMLGYWISETHNGKGYATEAVQLATRFAFDHAHLHRVQAGTLLHNIASQRVLEKAGYRFEGVALRYLRIDGRWQDHRMYAITIEDLEG
jgi:ribosomal-protein-alanine N-acetyltransferase